MDRLQRVMAAVERKALDRFPTDIWCVEEIREKLYRYCGTREWVGVLDGLDIDGIIGLAPPYVGPRLPDLGKNLRQNEWGMVDRCQEYAAGVYWEQVGYPLAQAETIADLDAYPWPNSDWYDYSSLPDLCAQYPGPRRRLTPLPPWAVPAWYHYNLLYRSSPQLCTGKQ